MSQADGGGRLSAVVAFLEFLIEVLVPELCLRMRFALGHVLIVQLALHLAVQNLQVPVRNCGKIFRELIFRCQVELFGHVKPLWAVTKSRATVARPFSGYSLPGGSPSGNYAGSGTAGVQPTAGAMYRAMFPSILALKSTPSWLGTVTSSVSAAWTAASAASCSARTSGAPA